MNILYGLELFGTAIFAISGAYTGAKKGMDIIGVLFLALVVGNGGGTIRDLLLNAGPVYWMTQHIYLWISLIAAVLALIFARFFTPPNRFLLIADALGLGVFAIVGADKALTAGYSDLIAILMGTLTGFGGSIIRDLVCNEVPLFLRKEVYATAAVVGIFLFLALKNFAPMTIAMSVGIVITFLIRLAAIYFDWSFPAFSEAWFHHEKIQDTKERIKHWWSR